MRAELANLDHCAVPFLSRAAVNLCWYFYTVGLRPILYIIHGYGDQNLVRPGTVDNRGRTIFNNFTLVANLLKYC